MAIEFHCSKCGKFLSTDESKAGRQAKCPGCGELVTVPDASPAETVEDAPVAKSPRPSRPCPMCGADVPRGEKNCPACGEELSADTSRPTPGGPVTIETGDVISTAWQITKRNLGFLVALVLVAGILNLLAASPVYVMSFMAEMQKQQNGQADASLVIFGNLWQIPANIFGAFLMCGQNIILLKLARGKQASLGELFSGGRFFLRMVLCNIVFAIAVGIGFVLCIIPGIIVALALSPFAMVLIAEDLPGIESLSRAWELTKGNRLTLLVLGFASTGIAILGLLACGVGLLVAAPLIAMMNTVAYLRMSGQPTVVEVEAA